MALHRVGHTSLQTLSEAPSLLVLTGTGLPDFSLGGVTPAREDRTEVSCLAGNRLLVLVLPLEVSGAFRPWQPASPGPRLPLARGSHSALASLHGGEEGFATTLTFPQALRQGQRRLLQGQRAAFLWPFGSRWSSLLAAEDQSAPTTQHHSLGLAPWPAWGRQARPRCSWGQ